MSAGANIEFIYFDLGSVLFEVNHELAWNQTLEHCSVELDELFRRFYSWGGMIQHMIGEISDESFFEEMKQLLEFEGDVAALKGSWESVFQPISNRVDIVRHYSEYYGVGALSNISSVHSSYIEALPNIMDVFEHRVYSWEVGFVKPREEIFQHAEKTCGMTPERILFIDDQKQHVEAAKNLGWQAVQVDLVDDLKTIIDHQIAGLG